MKRYWLIMIAVTLFSGCASAQETSPMVIVGNEKEVATELDKLTYNFVPGTYSQKPVMIIVIPTDASYEFYVGDVEIDISNKYYKKLEKDIDQHSFSVSENIEYEGPPTGNICTNIDFEVRNNEAAAGLISVCERRDSWLSVFDNDKLIYEGKL